MDVRTGKELRKLPVVGPGRRVAFSPDGALLAVPGSLPPNGGFICLFDTASGKQVRFISDCWRGADSLAFSPDGRTLASWHRELVPHPKGGLQTGQCVLFLWEVATGKVRSRILAEKIHTEVLAFSPDGRMIASPGENDSVRLWELATGKERHRLEGCAALTLAFSPDGSRLATGGCPTSVLVWDVWSAKDKSTANARLAPKELESLWADLVGEDAARAYRAQTLLTTAPKDTLSFLGQRLHPMPRQKEPDVRGLLVDLDANDFAVRQKAVQQLKKLGEGAVPPLQKALKGKLSLDVRRRVEQIVEELQSLSPEHVRQLRALEVLERLDTPESRQLLKSLSGGAPEGRLTQEAKAALDRLARRPVGP